MSTHNICFCGEIKKNISIFFLFKKKRACLKPCSDSMCGTENRIAYCVDWSGSVLFMKVIRLLDFLFTIVNQNIQTLFLFFTLTKKWTNLTAWWWTADHDQMRYSAGSDLGLHCLFRHSVRKFGLIMVFDDFEITKHGMVNLCEPWKWQQAWKLSLDMLNKKIVNNSLRGLDAYLW